MEVELLPLTSKSIHGCVLKLQQCLKLSDEYSWPNFREQYLSDEYSWPNSVVPWGNAMPKVNRLLSAATYVYRVACLNKQPSLNLAKPSILGDVSRTINLISDMHRGFISTLTGNFKSPLIFPRDPCWCNGQAIGLPSTDHLGSVAFQQ